LFADFLRRYFGIKDTFKLRITAHSNNGLDASSIADYWAERIDVPRSCVQRVDIDRPNKSRVHLGRNKLPYGCCTLIVPKARQ
jgi:hypothetical protein